MEEKDISDVLQIWLETNIKAHSFIDKEYWIGNYEMVKQILPEAEVYVEGLFVKETVQSNGIGKRLLDHAKRGKTELHLGVYQKNVRAVRFYLRENFLIQAEETDEDTNEKEYVMRWGK